MDNIGWSKLSLYEVMSLHPVSSIFNLVTFKLILENIRSFVLLKLGGRASLPCGCYPTRENSEVPVANKYLELCLRYVNNQRNIWAGTTLLIKVDDVLLIYLHLTYFIHWIYNSTSNLERVVKWVKTLWMDKKVPSSNPTRRSAQLRHPTSLQSSRLPLGWTWVKENNIV